MTSKAIMAALALMAGPIITPVSAAEFNILTATLGEKNAPGAELNTMQMREIMRSGSAIILDTRSRPEFDAGHIPGAVQISGKPEERLAQVLKITGADKTRPLALYCNGPHCRASRVLAGEFMAGGFTQVKRYQLGLPVWRALGGPVAIEASGVSRAVKGDKTAVFVDARPASAFAAGSLPRAVSAPVGDVLSGQHKKIELPEDDFNRRIILFGETAEQARELAGFMSRRPWHNVSYFNGRFEDIKAIFDKTGG